MMDRIFTLAATVAWGLVLFFGVYSCARAHEVQANECPFFGYSAGFISQDRNRGLSKQQTTERHLKSLKECMEGEKCTVQDGEDVQRILGFIDQIYEVPADRRIDPQQVYIEVTRGCLQEERARHMPKNIKERGPQIEA